MLGTQNMTRNRVSILKDPDKLEKQKIILDGITLSNKRFIRNIKVYRKVKVRNNTTLKI